MMRCRVIATLLLLATVSSCGIQQDVESAEQLPTPLFGKVLWATALHRESCKPESCQATYQVRIENTMQRDANVLECSIVQPPRSPIDTLPIKELDGLRVPAHSSTTWRSSFQLAISAKRVHSLSGRELRCVGIDWHGTSPA